MINGGKRGPKQNKPKSHSLPSQNHVNYQFHIISISIIIIHEILQKREEGEKTNWFFQSTIGRETFLTRLDFFSGFQIQILLVLTRLLHIIFIHKIIHIMGKGKPNWFIQSTIGGEIFLTRLDFFLGFQIQIVLVLTRLLHKDL